MKKWDFAILVIFFMILFKAVYAQTDCNPDGTKVDGMCYEECGASLECNGLMPNTGCCSVCSYVDINNDEKVNIIDISIVARHFGLCDPDIAGECGGNPESRGSISYNPLYDFNSDGKINIIDISKVARRFGKECPIRKDMNKYSSKNVFLISDEDWHGVLSLVPVAVWTNWDGSVSKYPVLIYHEEETGFDADSIIYFMQQYQPDNVTIIKEIPQELNDLLVLEPEMGAGINADNIQRISVNDYLSYWRSFDDVVYVEDDYELALLASTYASLINAPLVIQGTDLDQNVNFENKNVICVSNIAITNRNCDKTYSLEQLQQKYLELTNTDKIILINPNDLISIKINEDFQPEKSSGKIYEIYSRTSIAAPILASAKHELIISTFLTDYKSVDKFLEDEIKLLDLKPNYLTIFAAPNAIQMSYENLYSEPDGRYLFDSADAFIYANTDEDSFAELNFGRIFSLTISDVSSYVSRDLFYDETIKNQDNLLFVGKDFPGMEFQTFVYNKTMNSIGYTTSAFIYYPPASPDDWKNKALINYEDHGSLHWAGIDSDKIPYLDNTFIIVNACLTCAYDTIPYTITPSGKGKYSLLFCTQSIRKGGIGYIGSTDFGYTTFSHDILMYFYGYDTSVGETIKKIMNERVSHGLYYRFGASERLVLLGDPTFKLPVSHKIPKSNIQLVLDNDDKIVYNIIIKSRYFKFDTSLLNPENSGIGKGSFSSLNQLDIGVSSISPVSSHYVFELGPFPKTTQFKGMKVESPYIGNVIKYEDDPEMKNNIHYDMRVNDLYVWVILSIFGSEDESLFTYDDNFHDMDITLTLEKA